MSEFSCAEVNEKGIDVVILSYNADDPSQTVTAKIAPKEGSNLFCFNVGGNDIIEHLEDLPLADYLTGTPVLFPFPNRVEDCLWNWEGKTYMQKKDGIPVQMHSMVYDDKSWEYEKPYADSEGAYLKTVIRVDKNHPIYRGYPFEFELWITYKLTSDSVTLEYKVVNKSDRVMPYGFGLHSYFTRLSGDDDTLIYMPFEYRYEVRDDVELTYLNKQNNGYCLVPNILPTGKLLEVDGGYDLRTPVKVGTLDLDDVYTGKQPGKDVCIDYTKNNMKVYIKTSEEFTHYTIYAPPGKSSFAIEPQTCCTDAINLYARWIDHTHLMKLEPGKSAGGYVKFLATFQREK